MGQSRGSLGNIGWYSEVVGFGTACDSVQGLVWEHLMGHCSVQVFVWNPPAELVNPGHGSSITLATIIYSVLMRHLIFFLRLD